MDIPLEISYRGLERSDALDALVQAKVDKLDRFYGHLVGVTVTIEHAVTRSGHNDAWRIRIEMSVPNDHIVVTREPNENNDHYREDLFAATRDAFDRALRRLQDYKGRSTGYVKTPNLPPHARILRVFPYEGYGFVGTSDGRELYFHENAVLGATIHDLRPGMEVRYAESSTDAGPHVSSLTPVGKSGHESVVS